MLLELRILPFVSCSCRFVPFHFFTMFQRLGYVSVALTWTAPLVTKHWFSLFMPIFAPPRIL